MKEIDIVFNENSEKNNLLKLLRALIKGVFQSYLIELYFYQKNKNNEYKMNVDEIKDLNEKKWRIIEFLEKVKDNVNYKIKLIKLFLGKEYKDLILDGEDFFLLKKNIL